MFLVTQFIGLFVVNSYLPIQQTILNQTTGSYENITVNQPLPYGMQPPDMKAAPSLISLIISFTIAIVILLILIKYKWKFFIRGWFFVVVILALSLAFNSFLKPFLPYSSLLVLLLAVPLAYLKIYRPSVIIHNFTELLIYPGIAAVFVPILNIWTALIFLILISVYDMWAVWKSKIMIKMAKFQMNELKIFGGFFVPYMTKKVREKIAKLKSSKSKKGKGKLIRINLAILGGGDVVFPIITAGVFLKFFGFLPALFVILGATLALLFLFALSEKKKFYPAMPFISSGIFLALLVWRVFFF
jgi:presenilin-like A22 family membrane protease